MKKPTRFARLITALALSSLGGTSLVFMGDGLADATNDSTTKGPQELHDAKALSRTRERYGALPLSFEANQGQLDSRIKFVSRCDAYDLCLTSNEAVLVSRNRQATQVSADTVSKGVLARRNPNIKSAIVVRMQMLGSARVPSVEGLDRLPGCSNYFIGSDQSKWRTNLPNYSRVRYRDVYPGVDLIYYGKNRQLEYDFRVAPGSNPRSIKLGFHGARKSYIDSRGDLVLQTGGGDIRMRKPSVYQSVDGEKQFIDCRFVIRGKGQVGFDLAAYDHSRTLVIDPVFSYSTFLGGTSFDNGRAIAVDSEGNAYVTGQTQSFNFPTTLDAFNTTYSNSTDVFVTKMNPEGSALVYSTYIGGTSDDNGLGIAVDPEGNAYVTGSTSSSGFPTTPGAFQTTLRGGSFPGDAFVTKLNSTGTDLVYSTYLGGTSSDQANSIDINSTGEAYVAGFTSSTSFPTTPGAYQTAIAGGSFPTGDAFVTKLNATGTAQDYSTYLGGSSSDQATGIKVDSTGNAYVVGSTISTNFPTTPMAFQTVYGGPVGGFNLGDAFVTKVNATGTALTYSTYLGGFSDDGALGVAITPAGDVLVTGSSTSSNFPTTPGVVRVSNGGLAKTSDAGGSWAAINAGVTNSTVLALAIDPSTPEVLYAGTSGGGVFKSTNSGANWSATNSGLTVLQIQSLAIDPVTPSVIYLGTSNRGVFRSTNSGATWRAVNTGQNGMNVNVLRIDPTSNTTVYAGTDQGVFKTTNAGASWSGINSGFNQGLFVNTLVIDPVTTSTLYAEISFSNLYKSTNGGGNWSLTGLTNTDVNTLAIDPSMPSTLYAGTDNGVLKSVDGGTNWSASNTGLANRSVNAVSIPSTTPSIVYVGTANGVFKSTDSGTIWSASNSGLAGAVVNAIAIDPLSPMNVYTGSAAGATDAFVTKLNATGTGLTYSTVLGGIGGDQGAAIAVDASGNAYVTGSTNSTNFPTTPGGFQSSFGSFSNDAFVTKLNSVGLALVYSTHLGGTDNTDQGLGIAVDSAGSSYVTGSTQSQTFPITPDAYRSVLNGSPNNFGSDGFITKLVAIPNVTSDLAISMTVSPSSGVPGDSIMYNISVTNNGPEPVPSVTVSDDVPSSVIVSFCNTQQPAACFRAGNSVTFAINSLDPDASVTMSIFGSVSCSIGSSTTISNTVTVDFSGTDSNPSNNSAAVMSSATNPEASLIPTSQTFSENGGFGSVLVNRGANCTWSATSNADWITITGSTNCCNGFVQYSVASNPGVPRSGTMTIAGKTFTVIQLGTCSFDISSTSASFAANGGTGTVNVTAPDLCNWNAFSNDPSFLTITSGSAGTGSGVVSYSVGANSNTTNRGGTLFIAGKTFTVFQGAAFLDVPQNHIFYTEIGKLSARGVTQGCGGGNFCPDAVVTREQMATFIVRALGEFNPPIPIPQRFDDVPPSNPFYPFIDRLAALNITQGCSISPPLFCPQDPVLREQMAAFVIRALGEFDPPPPASQRFDDVPPDSPFYAFIDRMAALGITTGCSTSPPLYCPQQTVTRGQMAVFLVRAFGL